MIPKINAFAPTFIRVPLHSNDLHTHTDTSTSTSTGTTFQTYDKSKRFTKIFQVSDANTDAINNNNDNGNNHEQIKKKKHLVLIGGGHAHLQVIKAFNKKSRPKDVDVTLIDLQSFASYSGMVPGCLAKIYTPNETQIDLNTLSTWADVKFIQSIVTSIDPSKQQITLQTNDNNDKTEDNEFNTQYVQYDILSIDIGSASYGVNNVKGVKEYAIPTRPVSKLISRIDKEEEIILEKELRKNNAITNNISTNNTKNINKNKLQVVVIGGGVAGIELALSMKGRWESLLHDLDLEVTILNSGKELLPAESIWCREALQHILKDKMIHVQHGCKVQCVNEEMIKLVSGEYIPYTHCIWATGAEAHPLAYELGDRGIDIDKNGWIRVNSNLQSVSHSNIFAAGDCATIESPNYATPSKAGVYAVRSGPILIENISTCLNNGMSDSESLAEYRPQDDFLKLISCGDGTALGFRFGIPLEGKWVFELKDTIDQMFMDLFRLQNLPDLDAEEGKYDTSQYDERVVRPERLQPEEGAKLLLRKDEDVNYQRAWDVIRDMMDDEKYKQDVLKYTTRIECAI